MMSCFMTVTIMTMVGILHCNRNLWNTCNYTSELSQLLQLKIVPWFTKSLQL